MFGFAVLSGGSGGSCVLAAEVRMKWQLGDTTLSLQSLRFMWNARESRLTLKKWENMDAKHVQNKFHNKCHWLLETFLPDGIVRFAVQNSFVCY